MKWFIVYLILLFSQFSFAALRADINGDGRVDLQDLAILAEEWLMSDYGPELVVNGGFDTDTVWVKAADVCWMIYGGSAMFFPPNENSPYTIEQTIDITAGKLYHVSIDTVSWDEGHPDDISISAFLGGTGIPLSAVSYVGDVVAGSTDSKIRLVGTSAYGEVTCIFDNVSVREVLDDAGGCNDNQGYGNRIGSRKPEKTKDSYFAAIRRR